MTLSVEDFLGVDPASFLDQFGMHASDERRSHQTHSAKFPSDFHASDRFSGVKNLVTLRTSLRHIVSSVERLKEKKNGQAT